ncbi:MAG: hypothetical protein RMY63_10420 [Nostoc sp. ChiQUE01b]|nr:hypothetical protein [Nostoc sp. ChiQUE01b]
MQRTPFLRNAPRTEKQATRQRLVEKWNVRPWRSRTRVRLRQEKGSNSLAFGIATLLLAKTLRERSQ